jgi:ABC-type branched-subunit amino acid transport system substrate-binding protein
VRNRVLALLGMLSLLGVACGSRLTHTQVAALNPPPSGTSGSAAAAGAGSNAGVAPSTPNGGVAAGAPTASPPGGPGAAAPGAVPAGSGVVGPAVGPPGATTPAGGSSGVTTGVSVDSAVCAGPASGAGVTPTEVDVGNVSTLTGPVPGLFLGAQHGISAFAAYLNSRGGICGRRLVVKSADDNLDASQNATATQSLAESVLAFVGSFSGDDQGGASVLQADGIPDVGEALATQRFDLPNNFSPEPKPLGWNVAPYIYFKQKFPAAAAHMAVLTVNQSTAVAESQAEVQALESVGYKFIYQDNNIEPTQTDYTADAEAMKAKGALGLIFVATASLYADLATAMQNVGLKIPFADYAQNAYDPAFVAAAGDAANGAVLANTEALYDGEDARSVSMVALFDTWYRALYGAAPDDYANFGWMSGMLFIEGLNRGGGLTRASLLKGLKQVTNFNAGGLVADDNPAQKKPPACYLIIDIVNGKFVRDPVDPASGFDCANAPNYYFVKA